MAGYWKDAEGAVFPDAGAKQVFGCRIIPTADGLLFDFGQAEDPSTALGTAEVGANLIYAGPGTGADAVPTFRSLVVADIPALPASKITTGQLAVAQGGTGVATAAANLVFAGPTGGGAAAPGFRAIVRADLPTEIAYEDEANTFALLQTFSLGLVIADGQTISWATDGSLSRPAANTLQATTRTLVLGDGALASVSFDIVLANPLGGSGGSGRLRFWNDALRTLEAGQILYAGSNASGARYLGWVAHSDQDGIRLPAHTYTRNAAGVAVLAIEVLAGASAGKTCIICAATAATEMETLVVDNRTTAATGAGVTISGRVGTAGATTIGQLGFVMVSSTTADAVVRARRSGTVTDNFRFAGAGDAGQVMAALATNATAGFFWVPSTAGTPTGVPAATVFGGGKAIVVDSTNKRLCVYDGAWYDAPLMPQRTLRLAADATAIAAGTTPTAVATLQQAVKNGEAWDLEWLLDVTFSVTTDVLIVNVNATAGTATGTYSIEGCNGVPDTGAGTDKHITLNVATALAASASCPGNPGSTTKKCRVIVRATSVQSSADGTLQVLIRAVTSAGASSGTVTVKAGSQMIANRIS